MQTSELIIKPAVTTLDIHPVIRDRWSPRSFNPSMPVEKEKLDRMLEAARWAPSSFNEQPWRFILGIRGDGVYEKVLDTLVESNREWARNAPVLLISIGKRTYTKNGKPNKVFKYELGTSVAYMTFQAYSEGLVMHQMGGFSKEKSIETFGISEDFEPVTVIAVGYQDDPVKLPADHRKSELAPRFRRAPEDLLWKGSDTGLKA